LSFYCKFLYYINTHDFFSTDTFKLLSCYQLSKVMVILFCLHLWPRNIFLLHPCCFILMIHCFLSFVSKYFNISSVEHDIAIHYGFVRANRFYFWSAKQSDNFPLTKNVHLSHQTFKYKFVFVFVLFVTNIFCLYIFIYVFSQYQRLCMRSFMT